jgi:hypothetical protein
VPFRAQGRVLARKKWRKMALFSWAKGAIFRAWRQGFQAQTIDLIAFMLVKCLVARA